MTCGRIPYRLDVARTPSVIVWIARTGSCAGMASSSPRTGSPICRAPAPATRVASLADWRGRDSPGLWTNGPPESSQCGFDADFPSSISLQTEGLPPPHGAAQYRRAPFMPRTFTAREVLARSPSTIRPMTDAHAVVASYWAAADARDWQSFGGLLADDVVYEGPQTRERVRARDAYVRFNVEGFPGEWHIAVKRIVAEGPYAASWIDFTGAHATRPLLLRTRRRRSDHPHLGLLARSLRAPRKPHAPGGAILSTGATQGRLERFGGHERMCRNARRGAIDKAWLERPTSDSRRSARPSSSVTAGNWPPESSSYAR